MILVIAATERLFEEQVEAKLVPKSVENTQQFWGSLINSKYTAAKVNSYIYHVNVTANNYKLKTLRLYVSLTCNIVLQVAVNHQL